MSSDPDDFLPHTPLRRMWRSMGIGMRSRSALAGRDPLGLERWVHNVGELKGVGMKMAQIFSYIDLALPPEVQEAVAVLQTRSVAMSPAKAGAILDAELGSLAGELVVEPEAFASASVGQVHRGRLSDGTAVAVKVQFPEVEQAIRSDFRVAGIAPRMARLFAPGANIRPLIEEAERQFLLECDYVHEAESQERLRRLHEDDPVLVIPRVHLHLGTRHVLVSDLIDGIGLDAYLASEPSQDQRDRVGLALFRFYVGSLFFDGIYNGDPHPGNQLYLPDGRVAVLDHGCSRTFDDAMVCKLARLSLAVDDDDPAVLDAAIRDLGIAEHGKRLADARDLVQAFYRPFAAPGPVAGDATRSTSDILADKRRLMGLQLPGSFLFLLRIRFGLAAVLHRLGAAADWRAMERTWAEATVAAGGPVRPVAP